MRSFISKFAQSDADFARIHHQHLQLPPERTVEKQYWVHQLDFNNGTVDRDGPFSDFRSTGFPSDFVSNAQEYISNGVVEIEIRDDEGELIRLTNGSSASLDLHEHTAESTESPRFKWPENDKRDYFTT